jgi:hypothetical protein
MASLIPEILRPTRGRHMGKRASRALRTAAVSQSVERDTGNDKTTSLIPAREFERPTKAYETKLMGKTVDLSHAEPVLSAEKVKEEYGVDLGALSAVIELPAREAFGGGHDAFKPKLVYAFTRSGADEAGMTHTIMGQQSLDALHTASVTGGQVDGSLTRDVVTLSQGGNKVVVIGREGWLPELAYNTSSVNIDPGLHEQYETVSSYQAMFGMNSEGGLVLADLANVC